MVDFPAADAIQFCEREGILLCVAGPNVVRFIPPLVVEKEHIDRALDAFGRFLAGR